MNEIIEKYTNEISKINQQIANIIDIGKILIPFYEFIGDVCSRIDFNAITDSLFALSLDAKYLTILENTKWPLFFISDIKLKEDMISAYDNNPNDDEKIKQIVFSYLTDDFINNRIKTKWNSCTSIREDRKALLFEAVEMHNKGYYYASTSLLMCQVYGIASDIVDTAKKYQLELSEKDKEDIADYFNLKLDDIDKEKGKLIQMTMLSEDGVMKWAVIANYLKEEILSSSESKKRWEKQPLRNKICHGDQLNFGTKEHSLKAILVINILIQLSIQIENVGKIKKKIEE